MRPSSPPASGEVKVAAAPLGPRQDGWSRQAETGWLIAILGLSLLLRLGLAPGRWINPDEGAHLMDGRLALDGLLPFVDFASRQIAYTYVLAGLLRLSNGSYLGVRFCIAALTVANIYLVYLIARRLFDSRAGVAAALLYALHPLAVVWAPIVHTEPVAVFPICLGVYCFVRHLQTPGDRLSLVLAGLFVSLAYYARESSLGVVVALAVVLAAERWTTPGALLRCYGLFALGFLVPCAGLTLLYAGRITPRGWWAGPLNPLSILLEQIPNIGNLAPAPGSAPAERLIVHGGQPRGVTVAYLRSVGLMCGGLLAALAASLGLGLGRLGSARWREGHPRADTLLYGWLGGLGMVYTYWSLHRGFFPQYAEEFLPPLAILLGAVVADLLRLSLPESRFSLALGLLAAYLVLAFAASRAAGHDVSVYLCFLAPALALGIAQVAPGERARAGALLAGAVLLLFILASAIVGAPIAVRQALKLAMIPTVLAGVFVALRPRDRWRSRFLAFCAGTALVTIMGYSFGQAGPIIDLKYETVWPPSTVRIVAGLIQRRANEGDRVMSGGMIWDLAAGRRPFANVTHPLGFMLEISEGTAERLARELATTPPRFVVLDGYTEKTYGLVLPNLPETLAERYQLVLDLPGFRYPVRVYELRTPGPAS